MILISMINFFIVLLFPSLYTGTLAGLVHLVRVGNVRAARSVIHFLPCHLGHKKKKKKKKKNLSRKTHSSSLAAKQRGAIRPLCGERESRSDSLVAETFHAALAVLLPFT